MDHSDLDQRTLQRQDGLRANSSLRFSGSTMVPFAKEPVSHSNSLCQLSVTEDQSHDENLAQLILREANPKISILRSDKC